MRFICKAFCKTNSIFTFLPINPVTVNEPQEAETRIEVSSGSFSKEEFPVSGSASCVCDSKESRLE